MGFHGFSFGSLILVLILALLVFGTKRLRTLGEDLGAALRGFRKGLQTDEAETAKPDPEKIEKPGKTPDV